MDYKSDISDFHLIIDPGLFGHFAFMQFLLFLLSGRYPMICSRLAVFFCEIRLFILIIRGGDCCVIVFL